MLLNIRHVRFFLTSIFLLSINACASDIILPPDLDQVESSDMDHKTHSVDNVDKEATSLVVQNIDDKVWVGEPETGNVDLGAPSIDNIEDGATSLIMQKNSDIVWFAGHETGNISEWEERGGFVHQGSGSYKLVSPHAHTGSFSAALTIDTIAPSSTGDHGSYLFYWDQLSGDAYYYSAWYYIPSNIRPSKWWSIMQWKSTFNGNTDDSRPMFSLDARRTRDNLSLTLYQRPDDPNKVTYKQSIMNIPTDIWFQIEAYYNKSIDNTGEVIVWQDGVEVFNITGVSTVLADNNIIWSVHNYADTIDPNPCTIYIDDAAISKSRLGMNNQKFEQ